MLVKDIMTTAVRAARPEDPIREIAATMCFHKFSGLPVVDASGMIVGVISEKDILHGMFPKFEDLVASSGLAASRAWSSRNSSSYSASEMTGRAST